MFFQHGGIKHLIHIWPVEQKPRNLLRCCFCVNKYLIAALVLFLNCTVEGEPTKSGPKNESVAVKCEDSYSEFNSGMAYCRNKQWDEAIISFKKAIVLNPTNSLAYTCCGGAFFAKGEFIDAINCFSQAIKLDKTNSELYMNRAGAYRELGFLSKAMEDYNKSIKLGSSTFVMGN